MSSLGAEKRRPKVLIASLGTRGDVQPYASLALEFTRLGANVVVATGEGFEDMIVSAGARYCPLPIDYQQLLAAPDIQEALYTFKGKLKAAKKTKRLQKDVAHVLYKQTVSEQPDLILYNFKASTIVYGARKLNVPALPTCLQPTLTATSRYPISVLDLPSLGTIGNCASWWVFETMFRLGIKPLVGSMKALTGDMVTSGDDLMIGHDPHGRPPLALQGFSSALVPTPDDWPDHALSCGYWFTEPDQDYVPPDKLKTFLDDGAPPIYIGFGSMPSQDPKRLTETILQSLERVNCRAILATGWGGLTAKHLPDSLRARVYVMEKAPHSWLFPKCAAVVHHGGAGTTHEALRWGKPSLIIPVFGDQPFWGKRVAAFGAGPAPIKPKHLTAETLATALTQLTQAAYQRKAEEISGKMTEELGARGTAQLLWDRYLSQMAAAT